MGAEQWKAQQRKLREAIRARKRTSDGRRPVASAEAGATLDLDAVEIPAPDLLRTPIVSSRGVSAWPILAAKELLRRLLGPFVLEPQTRFNQEVTDALAVQREQLKAVIQKLEHRSNDEGRGDEHGGAQLDYFGFEQRFRGSEQAIESRQAEYLDYFFDRGEVLDIGCGRGEFLALLRERDIPARGVDTDEDMVARCHAQGLTVECADAMEFLDRQPDGTFGGVFVSQVVEHLTTGELVALLDAIGRKTSEDAVLIVETLNPESMPVLTRWFWLDPTHVRLVHPETLQYFIEQAGFTVKTVQFRRPIPADECLPALELTSVPSKELAAYNEAIAGINARLFGPLDYFVVGLS
jgi:2-polyprenyl-3-methyl-5-hydroxy-6-metoxy-1,4-benzoquinol methylase